MTEISEALIIQRTNGGSMMTVEALRRARELYAAAPSHVPPGELPAVGTVCVVTAADEASCCCSPLVLNALGRAVGLGGRDAFGYGLRRRLIDWNAEVSTDEVLAAFDRAIASAS